MEVIFWTCWVAAAIANSLTDWWGFYYVNSGWEGKYTMPLQPAPKTFYYRLTGLRYKERFFLAGTILISFTDKFHAFQLVQVCLIIGSIISFVPPTNHWYLLAIPLTWGIVTHISYIIISKIK